MNIANIQILIFKKIKFPDEMERVESVQSTKRKFGLTGPNQILEFIFIYF